MNAVSLNLLAALVNPLLMWAGVGAVSVPIIIHLLARRRFRRIRWAAMDFLVDAERRNRRRVRIEELILLALRCLAVALIAMLLARPFVKPAGVAAILGGPDRAERVFVIDDSFSMGYTAEGQSVFEKAKTSVTRLLVRLGEFAPHDTVTVLSSSALDSPIAVHALLDADQMDLIQARLETLHPSQRTLSPAAVIDAAAGILAESRDVLSATVYLVSDFQRGDWAMRGSGADGSPVSPLVKWQGDDRTVRVVLVDVGDDAAANRAISGLKPLKSKIIRAVQTPIEATIVNHTAASISGLELQVTVGQESTASARVGDLQAGRSAAVRLPVVFADSGDGQVLVEAEPDNLAIDDRRYLTAAVSDALAVLLVDGEQSADPYNDEVHLLRTALRPEGDVFSGNTVTVIADTDLDTTDLNGFDVVMLCNVYRVSELAADALHTYVRSGGGLAIFLGDQIADPQAYNAVLYREGAGLLPAMILNQTVAPDPGVRLAASDFLHPVVRVFSGRDNPFVSRIRFRRYFVCEPSGGETAAPRAGDSADGYRRPATVIARFDDGEMTPALIERPLGRGRVILCAAACDLEGNDWARDPSYVVTMLEMVQYLARSSRDDHSVLVGEPIVMPVDASVFTPGVVVRPPGYPQQRESEATAVADDDGGLTLRWLHTQKAGVYSFILHRRDGTPVVRRFAVNVNPDESDLVPASEPELRATLSGVDVQYIAGVPEAQNATDEGRREIWPGVLIMALAVLMVEQALAWRFGRSSRPRIMREGMVRP